MKVKMPKISKKTAAVAAGGVVLLLVLSVLLGQPGPGNQAPGAQIMGTSLLIPEDVATKTQYGVIITLDDTNLIYADHTDHWYVVTFPANLLNKTYTITNTSVSGTVPILQVDAYPVFSQSKYYRSRIVNHINVTAAFDNYTLENMTHFVNLSLTPKWLINIKTENFQAGSYNLTLKSGATIKIDPSISACGTLGSDNTIYTLSADVNAPAGIDVTCFQITGYNVTLDCAGYKITGKNASGSYGFLQTNYNGTIKNCIISNFSSGGDFDGNIIEWNEGDTNTLLNTTITTTRTGGYGLNLDLSHHLLVANSSITSQGKGIDYEATTSTDVENSNITAKVGSALFVNAGMTDVVKNSIIKGKDDAYGALSLYGGTRFFTLSNSTVDGSGRAYAMALQGTATSNTFINNTFINATTLVYLDNIAEFNTFYWNNFTDASGAYLIDEAGNNYYNTTIGSQPAGNIWFNVMNSSVPIGGLNASPFPGLKYGAYGTGYPYNITTSGGKFSCNFAGCADYAPLTPHNVAECSDLMVANGVYTLDQNLSIAGANCINVNATNVTLDCSGYTITGNNSTAYGIFTNRQQTTIQNCNVQNFSSGIAFFSGSRSGLIDNTNVSGTFTNGFGIRFSASTYNRVTNSNVNITSGVALYLNSGSNWNNVTNSTGRGTYGTTIDQLSSPSNNNLYTNYSGTGPSFGIYVTGGINNTFINCTGTATSNGYGFRISNGNGTSIINSTGADGSTNLDKTISIATNSNNVNIIGTTVSLAAGVFAHGIYIDGGSNVLVDCQGKTITGTNTASTYGIYTNQLNTTIQNCNVNNFAIGIYNGGANNSTFTNDNVTISKTAGNAFYMNGGTGSTYSYLNLVTTGSGASYAFYRVGGTGGTMNHIYMDSASSDALRAINGTNATVANSTFVTHASTAYGKYHQNVTGATVYGNTFTAAGNGTHIYLDANSSNNTFYWNTFGNTAGAYVNDTNGSNKWNTTISGGLMEKPEGTAHGEGNIWYNVQNGSVNITGTTPSVGFPALLVGTGGSGYPYNNSTSLGKFACNFAGCGDYAPLYPPAAPSTNLSQNVTWENVTFQVPANGTLIYQLEFERYGNSTIPAPTWATPGTVTPTSPTVAPNGLIQMQIGTGDYFEQNVMAAFGGVPALPNIFNRTYGIAFMLNGTQYGGQWVTVYVNITQKMQALYAGWAAQAQSNSTLLTYSSMYGGTIPFNSTRTDIPISVAGG